MSKQTGGTPEQRERLLAELENIPNSNIEWVLNTKYLGCLLRRRTDEAERDVNFSISSAIHQLTRFKHIAVTFSSVPAEHLLGQGVGSGKFYHLAIWVDHDIPFVSEGGVVKVPIPDQPGRYIESAHSTWAPELIDFDKEHWGRDLFNMYGIMLCRDDAKWGVEIVNEGTDKEFRILRAVNKE